jgi:hypothetical protein
VAACRFVSTEHPHPTPSRPVLRPGLSVYRRDDTHLQVGLDHPVLVLPDSDGIRGLLRDLEIGEGLGLLSPDAGVALATLLDADLVVDRTEVLAARDDRSGRELAALAAHGPHASARVKARATCQVALHSPEPWRTVAAERLTTAGIPLARAEEPGTVTLVVSTGEPPRSLLDGFTREDRPHLVLTLYADRARLGPFVAPGATACLRCLDAHLGESDPRRAVVIQQLEHRVAPTPCDSLLGQAAVALAVRELMSYAEGDRPATWSATLTLSAALGEPVRTWPRHPHCGCSWG